MKRALLLLTATALLASARCDEPLAAGPCTPLDMRRAGLPAPVDNFRRRALVVGNSDYSQATLAAQPMSALPAASQDAKTISDALKRAGYLVHGDGPLLNVSTTEFKAQLKAAVAGLGPGDLFLLYYAGHAIQSAGVNYLLGVSDTLEDQDDVFGSVNVDSDILTALAARDYSQESAANIVIIDACRDAPGTLLGSGIARPPLFPPRTSLLFAAEPNKRALDNSNFANTLADGIAEPGMTVDELYRSVRLAVRASTQRAQTPTDFGTLTSSVVVNPAVVAYIAVESGDDDVKIVHAGDSSTCARGFLSFLGCRAGFQTLKAGTNSFAIRVHNWRTFTGGVEIPESFGPLAALSGHKPEGWTYHVTVRDASGACILGLSDAETEPAKDGARHGKEFTAGRFDLNVDRQTRRITAANVAERIR